MHGQQNIKKHSQVANSLVVNTRKFGEFFNPLVLLLKNNQFYENSSRNEAINYSTFN